MDIKLKDRSEGPYYMQVRARIEALIRDKQLNPGDVLPAPAALARQLSIDTGEVQRAYFELEHGGMVTRSVKKDFLGGEKITYTVK